MNHFLNSDTILVVSAVADETKDIVRAMTDVTPFTIGRRALVRGLLSGKDTALLVTGPGMVNTAQSLGALFEHGLPSLVIQTGCAGIFRQAHGHLGDLAVATCENDLHSGIEPEEPSSVLPSPLPFPLLVTEKGPVTNRFELDPELADQAFHLLRLEYEKNGMQVFKGPFVTVSTITATNHRADQLHHAFEPVMESMEGSAAAQVALHYRVPFLEIRSASNRVGKRDRSAWNLPLAFANSSRAVIHLIENLHVKG